MRWLPQRTTTLYEKADLLAKFFFMSNTPLPRGEKSAALAMPWSSIAAIAEISSFVRQDGRHSLPEVAWLQPSHQHAPCAISWHLLGAAASTAVNHYNNVTK